MMPAENTRIWRKARRSAWRGTSPDRPVAPAALDRIREAAAAWPGSGHDLCTAVRDARRAGWQRVTVIRCAMQGGEDAFTAAELAITGTCPHEQAGVTGDGCPPVVFMADEVQELLAGGQPPAEAAVLAAEVICRGRTAHVVPDFLTSAVPGMGKARPAFPCPDHCGLFLLPLPGGAARGMCPADGRCYQLGTPEVV